MNAILRKPIAVAFSNACFEGHFPDRPILPGVTQFALILEALERETRGPVPIQGIAFARLRQIVLPGEHLELQVREQPAQRLRFDLKRGESLVANGEFILGSPQSPRRATHEGAVLAAPLAAGPPLEELLPHKAPMRFLSAIRQQSAEALICTARIPGRCALVVGDWAPAVATIEAAAQAAAAWEALRRASDTGSASPRIGYLVAVREVVFFTTRVPADQDLRVSVSLEAAAPPLTHYRFEVTLDGKLTTLGTIATFMA